MVAHTFIIVKAHTISTTKKFNIHSSRVRVSFSVVATRYLISHRCLCVCEWVCLVVWLWNVCYLRREQQEDDVYHDVNAVGWFLGNVCLHSH